MKLYKQTGSWQCGGAWEVCELALVLQPEGRYGMHLGYKGAGWGGMFVVRYVVKSCCLDSSLIPLTQGGPLWPIKKPTVITVMNALLPSSPPYFLVCLLWIHKCSQFIWIYVPASRRRLDVVNLDDWYGPILQSILMKCLHMSWFPENLVLTLMKLCDPWLL